MQLHLGQLNPHTTQDIYTTPFKAEGICERKAERMSA